MCLEKECCFIEAGYWVNKDKHQFVRNKMMKTESLKDFSNSRNNKGVFCTAYRYNTEVIDESFLYGDLYFDFDNKDDFEPVRQDALQVLSYLAVVFKIEHNQSYIYFSGNKGIHIIVPATILGVEPDMKLNGVYRHIAENIRNYTPNKTLDLVIYDNKRLFRIPGTIHESTGLYKTQLTYDELKNMSHEDIKNKASNYTPVFLEESKHNVFANSRYKEYVKQFYDKKDKMLNVSYKSKLNCTPPCIQHLLDEGVLEGNRNNTIAAMSSFYKNKGETLESAIKLIAEWNDKKNIPPVKTTELNRTVRSIYCGHASYGCNSLKNLSVCNEGKCPLKKKGGKN